MSQLAKVLSSIAESAATFPRPSGQPELCRLLLDIEGMAKAALQQDQENKALQEAQDCIFALGTGKAGWAWEEVIDSLEELKVKP